eukprot:8677921-Alexandrium_andersonii.AAC.1
MCIRDSLSQRAPTSGEVAASGRNQASGSGAARHPVAHSSGFLRFLARAQDGSDSAKVPQAEH